MTEKALALILTVLLALAFVCPVFAETTIEHPKVIVYGDVTKTVYPGRNIFEYKDDQGLSSTLPFERRDENITINFANILFDENFENKSIALATESGNTAEFTISKDYLITNGLPYIYLKMSNKTALTASISYAISEELEITDEPSITNDYYIFATAKPNLVSGDNVESVKARIEFTFVDAGATERKIEVYFINVDSGITFISTTSKVQVNINGVTDYYTFQMKISDILSAASKSWTLTKLTKIAYKVNVVTGSTLDASTVAEAYFRHALVLPSKIYIDDPFYENGLVVNGTSGSFTPSAGEIINIYGANATKITSVTIPWQAEITPEIQTDADNLQMQYTWEFTMPQSPSGVGDSLTFSNTNITLYGYKDGDAWDKLYLNGVDKLSNIASKQVDETTGYWTYGLASSLTEGNMYQIIARITYTADEFDSLTEAPVFWTNPVAWIQYKFWELVIAIASFLGLGTAWAVRQKRKLRTPKR
mgnify:CR=1 FL=1